MSLHPPTAFLLLTLSALPMFISLPTCIASPPPLCSPSDLRSLLAFQSSISTSLSWRNHTNCCLWLGILCNSHGRVVSVHLPSFKLLGSVPSHLLHLSSLHSLNLSNTSLSGHIPPSIANLSRLAVLDLSHNPLLTGSFPSLLPPKLQYLDLSHCSLHGFISLSVTNASSVKELYINHNLFSSFTPNGMGALQILDASSNLFNGSIPHVLFNCTNLRSLNLDGNHVGGLIPSELGKLSDLENLRLQRNHFTGSIPHEIGNCKQMRQIWLDDNSLNGSIPEVLGELPLLTALSLANNSLEGLFPEAIFRCTSLSFLSLRGNMLSGDIPAALGSLRCLKVLLLANNNFSGFIPFQFGCLRQLQVLDVSTNRLEGPIPTGGIHLIGSCHTPHDRFHGAWRNQFTSFSRRWLWKTHIRFGKILCNCSSDARENLSQSISQGWLWRMSEFLQFLDMDKGMQKAYSPCFLRTLQGLHVLGLTSNPVTKSIPRALAYLNLPLGYLGLSANNILQGSVHGHHRHILHSHGPNTKSPIIMGVLAGVGVFCAILLLVGLVVVCRVKLKPWHERRFGRPTKLPSLRKFRRESSRVFDPTLASISMRELVRATDDFDASNVIGDGGFGLVFCATLSDGRTVAVKKLATIGLQGKREFEAEMETLGNIKHQNLVELLAYCKVGDERVLVYEYVENGSLDTWLHERDDGPMVLDWKKRLRIAQGGARGLSYLHNDCNPFVIHRDIKSSNILLGKDFEPQIADFGLARNMSHMVSHVSTDVAGTLGYMAPEYSLTMGATKQADVYSFGIVMLELASRRRPNLLVQEKSFRTLAKWARHMLELGNHMDLLDPVFKKKPPPSDQVLAYFIIACDCVSDLPHHRPTINEAYEKLCLIGVP